MNALEDLFKNFTLDTAFLNFVTILNGFILVVYSFSPITIYGSDAVGFSYMIEKPLNFPSNLLAYMWVPVDSSGIFAWALLTSKRIIKLSSLKVFE